MAGCSRAILVAVLVLASGCADAGNDTDERARQPGMTPNAQGIGPAGGAGAAPRDMPGGSRWSGTPKSK
ncbi:MAG TPA: hypothetical protein VGG39_09740 [Polyangiaceae bacterium]|jgi:hypothetical protein